MSRAVTQFRILIAFAGHRSSTGFARSIGVDKATIARLLRGRARPATVAKIASALHIPVSDVADIVEAGRAEHEALS
jgi:plasmid maintenance system antidote protein VapI